MELHFLGTSAGVPTKTRNVTALALKRQGAKAWCLIDCGEGTQQQLLRTSLSLRSLSAVFITHVHGDHCYGLPGLLASAAMSGRTEPLALIGPRAVAAFIDAVRQHTALYLPFPLECHAVEDGTPSKGAVWTNADFEVTAHPLSHRVPSFAYAFTEVDVASSLDVDALEAAGVPRGPLWGQLQRGEAVTLPDGRVLSPAQVLRHSCAPRRIVVGGDNDTPALLIDVCRGAQVLVHEATYTESVRIKAGPGPQHSSALQVAQAAAEAGLPNLVLTHFSARYVDDPAHSPSIADVEAEALGAYGGRLFLARDFAAYVLDNEGRLSPR